MHRPLNGNLDLALSIVKACCSIHNFTLNRDGYKFEDTLTTEGLQNSRERPEITQGGNTLNVMRNTWADYFISEIGRFLQIVVQIRHKFLTTLLFWRVYHDTFHTSRPKFPCISSLLRSKVLCPMIQPWIRKIKRKRARHRKPKSSASTPVCSRSMLPMY